MVLIISFESLKFKKLFGKTIVLVGFLLQFYDLTQDYLHYNFMIESSIKSVNNIMPSITLCMDQGERKFLKNIDLDVFNPVHMKCMYIIFRGMKWSRKNCKEIDDEIFVRYRNNSFCLNYLGDLRNISNEKSVTVFLHTILYNRVDVIFHPGYTPSHFQRKSFSAKMPSMIWVELKKTVIRSLPSPYSTDCFDYSSNALNKVWPKSQTDCKLEHMRRKERRICGQNYHWINYSNKINNGNLTSRSTQHNCTVNATGDLSLDKTCKTECVQTIFHEHFTVSKLGNSKSIVITITGIKSFYKDIKYVGKMNLLTYFSSFGGLISMWMGLSAVLLTDVLYKQSNRFLEFIYYSNIKHSINRFRKYTRLFKIVCKLIFLLLMCYQIFDKTENYLEYQKATKISFHEKFTFPKIILSMSFQANKNFDLNSTIEKIKCEIHLDQIIIDCPKPKVLFGWENANILIYLSYFNPQLGKYLTNFHHAQGIKKIHFEFLKLKTVHSDGIFFYFTNQLITTNSHTVYISLNSLKLYKINNFFIESNNYKRITLENGVKCQIRESVLFSDLIFDYLLIDCEQKAVNRTLHCLPKRSKLFLVEPDSYKINFNFCPDHINIDYNSVEKNFDKCYEILSPDCEMQLFNVHNTVLNTQHNTDTKGSTEINIIPVNTIMTQYTEIYRMSFNDLIYQLGGIIGVWFGWSLITPSEIIPMLILKCKMIYSRILNNEYFFA